MTRKFLTVHMFVHLPKCLGTSLTTSIGKHIRESAHVFECEPCRDRIRNTVIERAKRQRVPVQSIRVIHGHAVFEGLHEVTERTPVYFTFLRDPVSRHVSTYNYLRTVMEQKDHPLAEHYRKMLSDGDRVMDYPEWAETRTAHHNVMSKTLAASSIEWKNPFRPIPTDRDDHLNISKRFLERMQFIGFVERSANDLGIVSRTLGMKLPKQRLNISKKYFKLDSKSKLAQRVRDMHAIDMELFEYGRQLRAASDTIRLAS